MVAGKGGDLHAAHNEILVDSFQTGRDPGAFSDRDRRADLHLLLKAAAAEKPVQEGKHGAV